MALGQLRVEQPEVVVAPVENTVAKDRDVLAAETVSKVDQSKIGTLSGAIELIGTVSDPSKKDKEVKKNKEGQIVDENVIGRIIGYRFKALQEVTIPDVGTTVYFKEDEMDFDPKTIKNTRVVKKGEEFNLTKFETALLLISPEYNAILTEGKYASTLVVQELKGEQLRKDNRPKFPKSVYLKGNDVSIRKAPQFPAISVKKDKKTGQLEKTVNPGFEKWSAFARKRIATPAAIRNESALNAAVAENLDLFNPEAIADSF